MGKLQSIELYNFKSYRGLQRAEFGTAHFTSIIGPNGSGKSNMMDAISFVLGIRSKELRSHHAKDLIYRNRVMESEQDGVSNGNGNSENGNTDPNDAYVKAIYIKTNGEELQLKRQVNSRGSSDYLINDKKVSAQQYSDVLAKENILIKAKNFLVFQGDVDAIAAQDPRSLCQLIEQISGASEYREEYEQLQAEKAQEASRQSALNQDKKRCAADVKLLTEQKHETEQYQKKLRRREDTLKCHLLWRLYHCEVHAEEKNKEHHEAMKKVQKSQKEFEQEKKNYETIIASHASSKKNSIKVEQKLRRQLREIDNCKNDMVPLDARIGMVETKINSEQKRREQIEREREKHDRDIQKHKRNIEISNKSLAQFEEQVASKLKEGFNITEDDIVEFQQLKDKYMEKTAAEQSQISTVMRQHRSASDELDQLESSKAQLTAKLETLKSELEEQQLRKTELTSNINDDNTTRASKKTELDKITEEERQRKQKLQDLNQKLYSTVQELSDYDAVQHESHKERTLRENGAALKRYIPGVYGFVHDLVDAEQEKYRTAVATVLGRHMNSIVVDSFRTGRDCIAYLKDNRMPSISFIPLDTISVKPVRSDYRGIAKGARLAIETVKYPEEVEPAVQYVCGDTIICDSVEVAKHVRWTKKAEVKTVSIDGTIIHKSNLMTGGSSSRNAQQWTDSKVRNLRNLQDSLKEEISKLAGVGNSTSSGASHLEGRLNAELVQIEGRLESGRARLSQVNEVINSKKNEIKHNEKRLKEVEPQIGAARKQVDSLQKQHEQIESSVDNVQQEIFGEFCGRLGLDNFKQFDENQSSAQQQITRERHRHEQQLKRLNQLLEASKLSLEEQKTRLERKSRAIEEDRRNLTALQQERQELVDRLQAMEAKRQELEESFDQVKGDIEAHKRTVKEYKDKMDSLEKLVEQAAQEADFIKQSMHTFINNRLNILRDCRMEGSTVPLVEGSLEDIPLDMDEFQQGENGGDGDVSMGNTSTGNHQAADPSFGIVIDYTDLDDEFKESDEQAVGAKLLQLADEISQDMETIRQKVDLHANEKLAEKKDRLRELESEFNSMQRRTKEVSNRFNDVLSKRRDTFMAAFEHVSSRITTIYKELTASTNVPAGGTASMYVENTEEPWTGGVNYGAMPPLKRYQPMELLSGGEKTMAAMALLFAIHSFQPSPFFVLDEIDAALDNANVASIARYINKHCGDNFQFIVISLKQGLFEHSESLVGIHRDQVQNSSKALMLDLRGM